MSKGETTDNSRQYHLFVSYAQVDNRGRNLITHLTTAMGHDFRSKTGRSLKMFVDAGEIATAQAWEERILRALDSSSLLLAILSPSYFTSTWCGKEWDYFRRLEDERTSQLGTAEYQKLIFPVMLQGLERILRPESDARRRIEEARDRQFLSFVGVDPRSERFQELTEKLVDDIIDVLKQLEDLEAANTSVNEDEVSEPSDGSALALSVPGVAIRYGQDRKQYVQFLSEATHVTVIGFTNENLAQFFEDALTIKRQRYGRHAFWESVRIVFLSDRLLPFVNDELVSKLPSRKEATERRAQKAGLGKRAVASFLLRANEPTRWTLYEYPYLLPFTGALFGMPDGSRVVQLAPGRPRRSMWEHLFFHFSDIDQYFERAFEGVIEDSMSQNEVILIGSPINNGNDFQCYGARFRRGVMIDGENITDWLPAVLVVTWWQDNGKARPLLQINSPFNSTREIGKVSHISGYINQRDYVAQREGGTDHGAVSVFELPPSAAEAAVRRELREEIKYRYGRSKPLLYSKLPFYYPDKENLYFYVYETELPRTIKFPEHFDMYAWSVRDLVRIRESQVLGNTAAFLLRDNLSPKRMEMASRILSLNLALHGRASLGEALVHEVQDPNGGLRNLLTTVDELVSKTRFSHFGSGQEVPISGLAGLQYREFFSSILPLYARLGVPDAEEVMKEIRDDPARNDALKQLSELYQDEVTMMTLPIEV
jgi:TIR domain